MSSKKFLLPNLPDFRALTLVTAPVTGPVYVPEMILKRIGVLRLDAPRAKPYSNLDDSCSTILSMTKPCFAG